MDSHLAFLHYQLHYLLKSEQNALTYPTLFEYFTAISFTKQFNKPFWVWKDIEPSKKMELDFPVIDKGVDITEDSFTDLVQVKYYQSGHTISFGKLATFLAFDKFSDHKVNLHLARTDGSRLSSDIHKMVTKGFLCDYPLSSEGFLDYLKNLPPLPIQEEIKEEFCLRPPQQEAMKILKESDRLSKNAVIQLPTGLGKTILYLDYLRGQNGCFLVLVPTLVLLDQWADEARKMGITNVYKIGTENNNTFTEENLTNQLVVCVYNSFDVVLPYLGKFTKVCVDEAHRITLPKVYQQEEDELDEIDEDCTEEEDDVDNEDEEQKKLLEPVILEEDEEKHEVKVETYTDKMKKAIMKHTRVVLLSATIDSYPNCLYYSYPLRQAIEEGYLCDYQLVVPIFSSDPNSTSIAEYLIKKGESHCIIYTRSIEECEAVTKVLNSLLSQSARYIHSGTSHSERETIIHLFDSGAIRFLVNVRVLSEGFNSPICSSVVFLHLPVNDTFILQCLGRALRIFPGKVVSNIYLPFSEEGDRESIDFFISSLCRADFKFKEVCKSKRLGSYLTIHKETLVEEVNEVVEHRYDFVVESTKIEQTLEERSLTRCREYIQFYKKEGRRPNRRKDSTIEEKRLAQWFNILKVSKKGGISSAILYPSVDKCLTDEFGAEWFTDFNPEEISIDNAKAYISFTQQEGRRPGHRKSASPEEKRLARYFNQLKVAKKGGKSSSIVYSSVDKILTDVFGEKWAGSSPEEICLGNAKAYIEFTQKEGNRPRDGKGASLEEKRLAQWFRTLQLSKREKKGSVVVYESVDKLLTETIGEHWEIERLDKEDICLDNCHSFIQFYNKEGRRPGQKKGSTIEEKRLAQWFNILKVSKKGGISSAIIYPSVDKILTNTFGPEWYIKK
jgi:superfamily II DNA or RNA helicase